MSSVVFHANGIGDDIINRPALAALAKNLPGPVVLAGADRPRSNFILDDLPFSRFVRIPIEAGEFDVAALALALPKASRVFVSMAPYFSPCIDSLRAELHAAKTIGFGSGYDIDVDMLVPKNAVELSFDFARAARAGRSVDSWKTDLTFGPEVEEGVERFLRQAFRDGPVRLLCVHTETFAEKRWNDVFFGQAVCQFLAAHNDFVGLFLDFHPFGKVCRCHRHRVLSVKGMSLRFAMAILRRATIFLGIDSCMLHAADHSGVPGVLLFSPATMPGKFGYYWAPHRHLEFSGAQDQAPIAAIAPALHDLVSQAISA